MTFFSPCCSQNSEQGVYVQDVLLVLYLLIYSQSTVCFATIAIIHSEIHPNCFIVCHLFSNAIMYVRFMAHSITQYWMLVYQPVSCLVQNYFFSKIKHLISLCHAGKLTNQLQKAQVGIIDQSECQQSYGRKLTANMMCAGSMEGGVDTCLVRLARLAIIFHFHLSHDLEMSNVWSLMYV